MSDNVQSQGYFGKLKTPIGDYHTEAWQELSDHLEVHDLCLNYDGTMIFSDERSDSCESGLIFAKPNGAPRFRQKCENLGHPVDPVKHYSCVWYNGADSPMSTATLEEVFP